jgi:hypothetical protein
MNMFWRKKKPAEPKFQAGQAVLWQLVPGGRFYPATITVVDEDGEYLVEPNHEKGLYHIAYEHTLRAAPGKEVKP